MARKNKSKYLYTFSVKKMVEEEKEELSKNEKGETVKTVKVQKTINLEKISLRRPSRRMYDNAELFYGVKLSEGIKAGLLTKALLAKRYEDDGGSMSDREKTEYFETYYSLLDKENDYQRLQLNLDNLDPDEKESRLLESLYDILELRKSLRDIEESQASLFNQTAENRARNQTLMWWVLHLGYAHGKPIFTGDSYEEKVLMYDDLEEEEDPFWDEVVKKLAYFVSFWYSGQATEKEDFDRALEIYSENNPTGADFFENEEEVAEDQEKMLPAGETDNEGVLQPIEQLAEKETEEVEEAKGEDSQLDVSTGTPEQQAIKAEVKAKIEKETEGAENKLSPEEEEKGNAFKKAIEEEALRLEKQGENKKSKDKK